MDLNIRTESTVLKMTLESGLVLNLQIPKPIQLTIANGMYWGGIGGNINRQADLMLLLSGKAPLVHTHTTDEVKMANDATKLLTTKLTEMDAAIQEAKDWAVVGWVL